MKLPLSVIDRKLAERSLADFVRQAWPVLEPKTPYLENWHLELLIRYSKRSPPGRYSG